ncbi:lysophosphatidic acid receptor 6-like [Acipenser oxyrinchus oxyrinchus]|uniref:Lysophosphatidic acid receptor 6-like n=1 Tax=Acipenser oxyrinchus oxyrinchus TaxID=40147 RepID=A0AAD8CYB9_ACIOX|nr:lysophosphatidic acid receptor 6-like [Acipenser oxyrinchus oxyrinchus]
METACPRATSQPNDTAVKHYGSFPDESAHNCNTGFGFMFIILPSIYCLVFLLSLAGNGTLLVHYSLNKKKSSSASKVFMANLAVLDLLLVLSLPLLISYKIQGKWPFGELLCRVSSSLFFADLYGSNFFLLCICLDRYVAVCHPLRYHSVQTPAVRRLLSCGVWVLILGGVLSLTLSGDLLEVQSDGSVTCGDTFSDEKWHGHIAVLVIVGSLLSFFLPYISVVICYALIARWLIALDDTEQSKVLRRKSMRAILSVVAVWTISYLPFHTVQLWNAFHHLHAAPNQGASLAICVSHRTVVCLASLNSFLDPLVYYFHSNGIRRNLAHCCKQAGNETKESSTARL